MGGRAKKAAHRERESRMKSLLVAGMILWSGTLASAQAQDLPALEKESPKKEAVTQRLLMGGTEIQGTVEKPHVVYVVPWKDGQDVKEQEIPLERSFREDILKMVDYGRFKRQWGKHPRLSEEGEKE